MCESARLSFCCAGGQFLVPGVAGFLAKSWGMLNWVSVCKFADAL